MSVVVVNNRDFGAVRCRNRWKIRESMELAGVNVVSLARMAGVTSQSVSRVLNGSLHSAKVLDALRAVGVAEELLCDPRQAEARQEVKAA